MKLSLVVTLFLLMVTPAIAQEQSSDVIKEVGKRVFTEIERQIIKDVLSRTGVVSEDNTDGEQKNGKSSAKNKNKGMPPGLAKKAELPPGLAKQQQLPPGLAKQNLPYDLTRQLPAPAPGTERVIVDRDVILIETGTDIILDIIRDVVWKNGAG